MPPVVWFTGLSGSGKSTLCRAVEAELQRRSVPVAVLDGDAVRRNLSKGLGYSREDRTANLRRISDAAKILSRDGAVVLVAAISPYRDLRAEIRQQHPEFLEVFVNAPLETCERRDPKGLYRQARAGVISDFTGISSPYEPPLNADVECKTDQETVEVSCANVMAELCRLIRETPLARKETSP